MWTKRFVSTSVGLGLCSALLLAGCSKDSAGSANTSKEEPIKPPSPVTLYFYLPSDAQMSAEDFKAMVTDPVKKKYPHITVERQVKALTTALSEGSTVDLIAHWQGALGGYKPLDFLMDITPLVKKHNFNLSKIDPRAVDAIKVISPNNSELYALPYAANFNGLYYNKAIFDKFGTAFPKDGMTWDETIDLAVKLTRLDGGQQYYGLGTEQYQRITFPLSLGVVNGKTNKSEVNTEPYKLGLEMYKKILQKQGRTTEFTDNNFLKDQNVAMFATRNILMQLRSSGMNWDVAQFPSYPDKKNMYGMFDLHIVIPNKHTKHPDDVMRVMEVLLSEESQEYMAKTVGRMPTMADPKFKQMLGQAHPEFNGKSIASILKGSAAPGVQFSEYYEKSAGILTTHVKKYIADQVDINTMLRQADEEINQYIATQSNLK